MPEFDFHGVSVAYDRAGSGDPILFLHNIGGDRRIWSHQMRALAATNSVYALDLFGYGESDIPTSGYTVDNYVRLLSEFVADRGLQNITLVGNCFGSALSLFYARQETQRVRALVLCSPLTAATLRPTPTGWTAKAARHIRLDALAAATKVPTLAATWVVREQLGPRGRHMDATAFAAFRDRWTEPRRLLAPAAIARDFDRLAALDDFRPTLAFPPITTIWGAKNRILSATAGSALNRTLSPTRSLLLPDCGHLLMLEDPDTITAAIRSATASAIAS
ncbi:alpha/beta hydrolase [Nocardia otitidiscaviarum]|uniref:alpha/beta fold hydrolase n=1 Tax=Nocardia otitidiscaviarum TaxID=1823 RepID=UPI000694A731|nr:alpha/beta hydrolase [Nocardia otitidiscaviarum]MBF6134851.1 alpha/beta hydrolase [Nocardia otitidiscaviarum]MBF6485523.1 alpha/beta hydrolase [Nocardia otitidiscaviarum]